ncbi:NAD(P)H-dependent glycerol-3-phosphate dehydrogenase [Pseudoroseicyclus tamaricis]|uniref:Glycerol-3-phosphate dehydrogenase [NAD(P)+] n=1 Tax=Pseudoroseicyclus tamaricis TaxID=2705421 RepID=A0A6B2K119_9RHOB|nr:NAD(P)H-dependent glycerol-3-phosphate dehydrogenase [Pseudoroseicyclus tamaricis]NDV02639.1 NAD(P)-dependent glycerol-3-phosphate dehydrogenase [Pseudoroseicyclus tamaricis]
MTIAVAGAGAFGTALAIAEALAGREVILWGRDPAAIEEASRTRRTARLPQAELPEGVRLTSSLDDLAGAEAVLLAVPAQALRPFLAEAPMLAGSPLVACAKGIDLATVTGPTALIEDAFPGTPAAVLTGPSFAADIAKGLPTALTLACADETCSEHLQHSLSTPNLRLYRSTDVTGAELGGALKNVMAIACGAAMGAELGESARAALLTRGFAEMQRLALALGARAETLAGLSGFGDLVLTATSPGSRNYRYGLAIGARETFDPSVTVEGAATAGAALALSRRIGVDLPITAAVAALVAGEAEVSDVLAGLLSRPLKEE